MCARFYIEPEGDFVSLVEEANRRQMKLTGESTVHTGECFPGDNLPALAGGKNGQIAAFPMKWGFTSADGKKIINARSESAGDKKLFSSSWQQRRCLIPADAYFEWNRLPGGQKIKYRIRPQNAITVGLAGIYRYEVQTLLPCCAILTRAPGKEVASIHDRMPVILEQRFWQEWLSPEADPEVFVKHFSCTQMELIPLGNMQLSFDLSAMYEEE